MEPAREDRFLVHRARSLDQPERSAWVELPHCEAGPGRSGIGAKRPPQSPALQHRPRILFLDEPTAGLDPQTRNQIWEFIRGLRRDEQVTVFFTTHYMEEAERVADRIAVIDHGRMVAEGTAAALRQETGGPHAGGCVHRADWA